MPTRRARATGGAGLGLAIVRQLVTMLGGTVAIRSQPGVGTAVWFTCPVASADAPPPLISR